MFGRHDARRVTQYTIPCLESRRRRPPAPSQTRIEQRLGIRALSKDGDRRHRAESGRIEYEVRLAVAGDDDVVRVFVLRDDLRQAARRLLRSAPGHHVCQRAKGFNGSGDDRAFGRIEIRIVVQRYGTRVRLARSR